MSSLSKHVDSQIDKSDDNLKNHFLSTRLMRGAAIVLISALMAQKAYAQNSTSFGTPNATVASFCSAPAVFDVIEFNGNGQGSGANNSVATSSTASTGVSVAALYGNYDTDTRIFDDSEHTTQNSNLGFNDLIYGSASIVGLNDVFTQTFSGDLVYEIYVHINSLDQIGFEFDTANNPNVGWQILSSNDDGQNIGTGSRLFFVDNLNGNQDGSRNNERLGGNGGRSGDGTIRLFSTNGSPISQIIWSLVVDDDGDNIINDRFQLAMETCHSDTELDTSESADPSPSLSMTKVADNPGPHAVGDVITYTYTVTNDGDTIVRDVSVNDTHNGSDPAPVPGSESLSADNGATGDSLDTAVDGSWDVLAPGDVVTFTGTYTVTQIDVDKALRYGELI